MSYMRLSTLLHGARFVVVGVVVVIGGAVTAWVVAVDVVGIEWVVVAGVVGVVGQQ
jgi:hypothetical protein